MTDVLAVRNELRMQNWMEMIREWQVKKSARPCHLHGENLPPFRKKLATLPDQPATSDFASIMESAHD